MELGREGADKLALFTERERHKRDDERGQKYKNALMTGIVRQITHKIFHKKEQKATVNVRETQECDDRKMKTLSHLSWLLAVIYILYFIFTTKCFLKQQRKSRCMNT